MWWHRVWWSASRFSPFVRPISAQQRGLRQNRAAWTIRAFLQGNTVIAGDLGLLCAELQASGASSRGKAIFHDQGQDPAWHGRPGDFGLWKSCEKRRQMRGLIQGSPLLINQDPPDWGLLFCLRRARNRPASGSSRAAVGPSHQGWPQSIEAAVGSTSPAADRWARAGAARGMTSSRTTGTSFSAA